MKRTLTSFICFLVMTASSQSLFEPGLTIAGDLDEIEAVHSADLDGDGDFDVIAASSDDNRLVWFENLGPDLFSHQKVISEVANGIQAVYAKDLDLDGDVDIVASLENDDSIAMYMNDGSGNFSSEIFISQTLDGVLSIYVEDLNQDGYPEVISASSFDDKIAYFLNDGFGGFSSEIVVSSTLDFASSVIVDDIDLDGDPDIIAAGRGNDEVVFFRNEGFGVFSESNPIGNVENPYSIFSGDLDGDGDADIAVAGYDIFWFENDGDGNFISETELSTYRSFSISGSDFDSDGDIDLVCGIDDSSHAISMFENFGDGTFSTQVTLSSLVGNGEWVYLVDLDLDGDLDILYASHSTYGTFSWGIVVPEDNSVGWIENLGDGNFSDTKVISSDVASVSDIHLADLDSDGYLDVLASLWEEKQTIWYKNLGNGLFRIQPPFSNSLWRATDVDSADLDSDGDIDVVCTASGDGIIRWYENDGFSEFSSHSVFNQDHTVRVLLGDLDIDGDIDILSYQSPNSNESLVGNLGWHANDGSGNFGSRVVIVSFDQSISFRLGDMDSDGDLDILENIDDEIHWIQNDGSANFSSSSTIAPYSSKVWDIETVDFDLDGDLDVLATRPNENKLSWYANDGLGSFSAEIVISDEVPDAAQFNAVDWDGDGDVDVVLDFDNSMSWLENQGDQSFNSPDIFHEADNHLGIIKSGDLDLNGYPDVVWCSGITDEIVWHKNNGTGCTDVLACNYNPEAQIDSGNCCYADCGCTDSLAINYDPEAVCEDYTCEFVEGCSNEFALNYNSETVVDDGSCLFEISGQIYYDENENGIFDAIDYGLSFQSISIEPVGITLISDDNGMFTFYTENAEVLTISAEENTLFPFNITPNPIFFDPQNATTTFLEFGVSSELQDFGICIDLYSNGNNFLCNAWSNHNICYRNMGNVPIDGIVELEYDPLFQGHSEVTPIDSTNGNIVYMSFENLLPGQMFFYDVDLLTPTVDYIGEFVTSYARVTGFYEGDQVAYGEQTLEMEIACAYDPNDKQAYPLGYTDEHWLLQQTEQEFLIRFQNTGNAPAQNIRIQDTLDVNFDIESFKLMANSHSVLTTIDPETRLIDFYFEDIQLPDSVNNEPDSHGLVSYKITPLPNLPVGTVLENTAYIYFDNNEPIVTNTTWTTIHECGGESAFEANTALVCNEPQVNFESSYEFLESYSWQVDGMVVGMDSEFTFSSFEQPEYEITLIASNPLCEETTTVTYATIDIELLDPCIADYTCDGLRNSEDLMSFLTDYGCIGECEKDLNGNGLVNAEDLMVFLSFFGRDCWE